MGDPNHKFNMHCNQMGAELKHARVMIYGNTPTVRLDEGNTEVTITREAAGKYSVAAINGGSRRAHVLGVAPIDTAKFFGFPLPREQAHTIVCTAEDANTTLHEKGFVIPFFDQDSGRPRLLGVWYDVGGGGTQPTLTDPNGALADVYLEITGVSASDPATTVATVTKTALEAFTRDSVDIFTSSVSTATITCTDNWGGRIDNKQDAHPSNRDEDSTAITAGAGTSGFTVSVATAGRDAVEAAASYFGFHNDSAFADPQGFMVSYLIFKEENQQ